MNTSSPLSLFQVNEATERLAQCPGIVAAYLHGSAVKAALRADSDVDIALLLRPRHRFVPAERLALAADLEAIFGRGVDLGLLSPRNLVYATQVISYGQLLFTRDVRLSDDFAAHTFSGYAQLQVDRAAILARYAA